MSATSTVYVSAAALLGAIVGSFLNVVIYRLPHGTFFSGGSRSVCANPECRAPIAWHDNVPVLGWLWLRGRARCCGARISVRYPLVEALTAALFLLLWVLPPGPVGPLAGDRLVPTGLLAFAFYAFFVSNLVANSFIDVDHRILPDVLTKSGMAAGLLGSVLVPGLAGRFGIVGLAPAVDSLVFSGVGLVAGFGITWAIRALARAAFAKEAMGFGDVKLMGAIGAFLGWSDVLLTFFVGCVLGAVVGVVHRWLTKDAYICFGPFLAAGALIVLFAGDSLLRVLASLQEWQVTSPAAPWVVAAFTAVSTVLLIVLVRRGRAS